MARKKLIWQLYPTYLVVTLAVLVAVTWYCSHFFRHFDIDQTRKNLTTLAYAVAEQMSTSLRTENFREIDRICKQLGLAGKNQTRFTVILPSGKVVGDSDEDPMQMTNHSDRHEIKKALSDGFGWSLRLSPTLGKNMMYVAVPIKEDGEVKAVVRTAIPATAIDDALKNIYIKIFWGGVATAFCAAGLSLLISRRISEPIVDMRKIAERFASGDLDHRLLVLGTGELDSLANALNRMATQLQERIAAITDQRNEMEAVLSSMIEGVVAVDPQGRIVSINKAAANLLDIELSKAQNRNVEEVIRNVDLQEFINRTLNSKVPTEADISLPTEGDRLFQLHGASLPIGAGGKTGAVIVLNDVTRMRRLENVRRDFVANVSHELKTPVTSIQGYVEALLEGAIKDPQKAERFLKIIARHSDRLNAIIEDLLTLSRLEEGKERKISFGKALLKPVLQSAIELSSTKAEEKQMVIALVCDDHIEAQINAALLEQAVVNLVDNAIKYSLQGSTIRITAEQKGDETTISVQDNGCGIAQEHLPRIFERFYVIDKGRSRKLGGTGLGLAIVKHIAQVHGGHVAVESSLGKGSTFTIHLSA
ncbi:MAG: ATP-binding protein [Planctomycetota bacterium]|nr:ATP-binding protein [Planctomycetota bacterium]